VCSSDLPNPKPQTPNPKPQTPNPSSAARSCNSFWDFRDVHSTGQLPPRPRPPWRSPV